jgi:hypothetical protein
LFTRLSEDKEVQLDIACQYAIWKIIPSTALMIIAAKKHALAIEAAALKEME